MLTRPKLIPLLNHPKYKVLVNTPITPLHAPLSMVPQKFEEFKEKAEAEVVPSSSLV